MPTPKFSISTEDKAALVEQLVPQTITAIDAMSAPGAPLADDFIDVLSQAIGMMVAADTNLNTPQKLRLGAATVAQHIERHAKAYRKEQEGRGESALTQLMNAYEMPELLKQHWLENDRGPAN